ncbi:LacI family DNA-binding transcriptional regulator [Dactylosporangium matsuzakiense]|uniref:LacI family transcriptional regulator n=1 Tax=Dactylosporangium matsuzakiense TaxID=53360 RepID=A0A9W6NSC0_9ACTN|nr:LacI family DNA-binding transcriptional regulator [Dactylosporangium matsuzakiense]UWZ49966.1 LacI family DNA-binding transcriptional regulator [Dactylosporangium matsuzakiense]GLL07333.1 LacI family transcriptional regulator [Dactylosporangium matsuzakiense]
MADVAARAGVSLKTVSRVVNDAPYVQPELAERVLAAVAELGFRRNHLASSLRSGQATATIGLLIEEIANPFYATIAGTAAEIARQRDTMLIIASSEEDPVREQQLLRDLCARRVDGLLIVPAGSPGGSDHSFLRAEVELGTPAVFLDRPAGNLRADTVLLDNRGGAREGVRGLVAASHRRIAVLLDSIGVHTMRERLDGAQDALVEAGAPYDERLVRDGVRDPAAARRVVAELLERPDPPTAFFSLNNRITLGVVEELYRRRSDAALLAFDDFELARLVPYPLTVIAYDTRAMARTATELLFRRIDGDRSWPRTVTLPTELVERGLR